MSGLVEQILNVNGVIVYALVAGLVFAEDAFFLGFVIPGETAAVLGGVDASRGHVSLSLMIMLVTAAAIIGDSVGYEVGRTVGPRVLSLSTLERHRGHVDDARSVLARSGGSAVFFGRFVAFFRAVMPALAGASRMPYRRFLVGRAGIRASLTEGRRSTTGWWDGRRSTTGGSEHRCPQGLSPMWTSYTCVITGR